MNHAHPDVVDQIRQLPLFDSLDTAQVAEIANASCYVSAQKHERLYWQGDTPQAFYHVVSGHVRRAVSSPAGDEWVIDIFSAGQHFSLVELFSGTPYLSFAEAVEPTQILRIGKIGLLHAVAANTTLATRLLAAIAQHQASFERDVAACFFHSGCRRLLDYLMRTAGPRLDPLGDTELELPVSKRLIAARIGMSAESLSRAFRELSDAGFIRVRGRKIVLLEKLASEFPREDSHAEDAAFAGASRRRTDLHLGRGRHTRPAASHARM